ncbi:MAG: hypothetical protein AAF458_22150 [Pseudomonadota bacterium]
MRYLISRSLTLVLLAVLSPAVFAVVITHDPVNHAAAGGTAAGKVLYVWEGASDRPMDTHSIRAKTGYIDTLTQAGYDVVEVALTRTANSAFTLGIQNNGSADLISHVLDATFDQVWVVNNFASNTPPNLSAADINALRNWSDATSRDEFVMDAMGWRFHENNPDETNLTTNIVNTLQDAGGGIYVAADNEQGGRVDGSGTLIATVNQVMDEFNFERWKGVYTVPASTLTFGGALFNDAHNPVDPTNVAGSVLGSVALLPVGLQPNGRELFSAISGPSTPLVGSAAPAGGVSHTITSTIAIAASTANVPAPLTLWLLAPALVFVAAYRRKPTER